MKGSSKKNSLKPNATSHNNASWYTDTHEFLEHTPSGWKPALQDAAPLEDNSILSFIIFLHHKKLADSMI